MRYYYKRAEYELLPYDDVNAAPVMYVCDDSHPFRLAAPCAYVAISASARSMPYVPYCVTVYSWIRPDDWIISTASACWIAQTL